MSETPLSIADIRARARTAQAAAKLKHDTKVRLILDQALKTIAWFIQSHASEQDAILSAPSIMIDVATLSTTHTPDDVILELLKKALPDGFHLEIIRGTTMCSCPLHGQVPTHRVKVSWKWEDAPSTANPPAKGTA